MFKKKSWFWSKIFQEQVILSVLNDPTCMAHAYITRPLDHWPVPDTRLDWHDIDGSKHRWIQQLVTNNNNKKSHSLFHLKSTGHFKSKILPSKFVCLSLLPHWTKHVLRGLVPLKEKGTCVYHAAGLEFFEPCLNMQWPKCKQHLENAAPAIT